MIPVWLSNLEFMCSVPANRDEAGVLRLFMAPCARWIAENRVAGNPANEAVIRRALALFTRMGDWSQLRHDHAASDLRNFTARLKGLVGI